MEQKDHSVQAYILRQPTEVLQGMLNGYFFRGTESLCDWENIVRILNELKKREKDKEITIIPQIQSAWDKYLRRIAALEKEMKAFNDVPGTTGSAPERE